MFYSLIRKDKHLLFLIVSDNMFNFLLLECSTEGHSQSTPQHSLRASCWERSSAHPPAAANGVSALVLDSNPSCHTFN